MKITTGNIHLPISILILFICIACSNNVETIKAGGIPESNTADDILTEGEPQTDYDTRSSQTAQEIDKIFPGGVLGLRYNNGFSIPLIEYYVIYGKYPDDVSSLLNEGLLWIWPSDPETGKPRKLVNTNLQPAPEDLNKIAYIKESDNSAYFEVVFKERDDYQVYKFPDPIEADYILDGYSEQNIYAPDVRQFNFFGTMRDICQGTFFRGEYWKLGNPPSSISEALNGNYFWIKENMKPEFISDDPKTPYFAEWGTATLNGEPVYFLEVTDFLLGEIATSRGIYDPSNCRVIYALPRIKGLIDEEENWDKLSNITYYYSTRLLLKNSLNLPDDVLISREDILQ